MRYCALELKLYYVKSTRGEAFKVKAIQLNKLNTAKLNTHDCSRHHIVDLAHANHTSWNYKRSMESGWTRHCLLVKIQIEWQMHRMSFTSTVFVGSPLVIGSNRRLRGCFRVSWESKRHSIWTLIQLAATPVQQSTLHCGRSNIPPSHHSSESLHHRVGGK